MNARHLLLVCGGCLVAGGFTFAQVGRGGTQWPAPLGDAQRTSWIRSDDKISVQSLSKGGFDLQWKAALDNPPRGGYGLGQGITASGVTLFVPMSVITGSSNTVYGIDNDLGYVVWKRRFEAALPAATTECPGGIASGATRIVRLDATPAPGFGGFGGRGNVGYRTLLGEPGEGVPLGGRGAGRGAAPAVPPAGRQGGAPAPPAPAGRQGGAPAGGGRGAQPERIPGAPAGGPAGGLARPSGVAYVISSDGMLHVMGLASGKDIQRPAPFVPANSRWSSPVAVDTTLYAATSSACAGAPSAVWAVDLDSDAKPVVSWKTNGGDVVGAVAFTTDGTLVAATSTAIVALDPKTLQLKGSFTDKGAQFATGPTILRHNGRDIVAAATRDGRVLLLDAAALASSSSSTPLFASKPLVGTGGSVSADALAAWQQMAAAPAPAPTPAAGQPPAPAPTPIASWILVPVAGRLAPTVTTANGPVSAGAVVALKVADANGALSLEPAWTSHDLSGASTPLVINGVVFALAKGQSASKTPAVLHAYDGATGKRLWNSGKSMTTVASPGSLWTGLGQIYVGSVDGTAHAFGFPDERR